MFSPEQTKAMDSFYNGDNLFITGAGGTGKSYWIRQLQLQNMKSPTPKNIQVCALTGCASILLNCNACTLHSWAGIGIGKSYDRAIANKFTRERWCRTDVLIVDEVSMLSKELFEMLNEMGQKIRFNKSLFGGIQLIFCGDFYQLPPVDSPFCFESHLWEFTTIVFNTIYRQTEDTFQRILNEIRKGKISRLSRDTLLERVGHGGLTKLVPTRQKANRINTEEYKKLQGPEFTFEMSKGKWTPEQLAEYEYLSKHINCEPSITFKVGCHVMCTANLTSQVCNGSQGIITRFENGMPVVQFKFCEMVMPRHSWKSEKMSKVSIEQIPLIYAWAITIHKSQGASLDSAEIDLGNDIFEAGQFYVALSRVKYLEGVFLSELEFSKIILNKKVVDFYSKF
jgi:ATP-dependent DNA helicase PIF1